ncbi:putative zinc finger protein [Trypanosoma rangeli]|uniref:Putative zinc finger protein n=1 Tax=Trypanosoma rangeli TaxID=5698 RepID=A0A3R7KI74_TRYRA|nr:putative zinc finger protein [Trypanosoma rangeli]RNF06958.1 putative zinc finger protein [Trypanosoma rangeli]|eukprot:RNF06958.1 putative zinc finger protein [Trypanosoma rangeli]
MPVQRINFGDLNDGIDWVNALPPHVLAQQHVNQALRLVHDPLSFMLAWPIPEDSFPVPRAIQLRREAEARGTAFRSRRGLVNARAEAAQGQWDQAQQGQMVPRNNPSSESANRRLAPERIVSQPRSQQMQRHTPRLANAESSSARLAPSGMDSDIYQALSYFGGIMNADLDPDDYGTSSAIAFSGESLHVSSASGAGGASGSPTYTRVAVSVQVPAAAAPRITAHVERGVVQPRHHSQRNRSGVGYDIITGYGGELPVQQAAPYQTGGSRGGNHGVWEIDDFSFENLLRLDEGNKSAGLSLQQIRGMRPVSYASVKPNKDSKRDSGRASLKNEETCAICLEEYSPGTMVFKIGCGHIFHHGCIVKWLKESNRCPTCRYEIPRIRERGL